MQEVCIELTQDTFMSWVDFYVTFQTSLFYVIAI